ncbi:hypothetical protein [Rubritalea tangerina]|uniref:hypothetical protein n=1 Tax=Rubritalea tangerina TaxID=430798 RepID=UPI00361D83A0
MKQVKLKLRGKRKGDDVTLSATAESGNGQSEVSATVPASRLVGGVGLLSHPGKREGKTASLVTALVAIESLAM